MFFLFVAAWPFPWLRVWLERGSFFCACSVWLGVWLALDLFGGKQERGGRKGGSDPPRSHDGFGKDAFKNRKEPSRAKPRLRKNSSRSQLEIFVATVAGLHLFLSIASGSQSHHKAFGSLMVAKRHREPD